MIDQNVRKIIVAVIVVLIALLSSSCNLGFLYTPKGDEMHEADVQVYSNLMGTYKSTGETYVSDVTDNCAPEVTNYAGKKETFALEGNTLNVSDENGQRTYAYQDFGEFCRELDKGQLECIQLNIHSSSEGGNTSDGYLLHVYENKTNLKECYEETIFQDRVDQSQMAENQIEEGDNVQNGTQENTDGEQGSPEFDISSCWPKPTDYTLEIVNFSDKTSSNGKRSCNADGTITNTGDQKIMFTVYRVNHYGNETTFGEKWKFGYLIIQPGETMEYGGFHHCVGSECGEGEWFYIQRLSIINDYPECSIYNDSFEDKAPESIVNIENPCDW